MSIGMTGLLTGPNATNAMAKLMNFEDLSQEDFAGLQIVDVDVDFPQLDLSLWSPLRPFNLCMIIDFFNIGFIVNPSIRASEHSQH